jgi:hypothetical protein
MFTTWRRGDGWSSRKRMGDGKITDVSGGYGGAEEKEEEGIRI